VIALDQPFSAISMTDFSGCNQVIDSNIEYISRSLVLFFLGALTGPYPTLQFGGACGLGLGVGALI
jgi:hypothetical protein